MSPGFYIQQLDINRTQIGQGIPTYSVSSDLDITNVTPSYAGSCYTSIYCQTYSATSDYEPSYQKETAKEKKIRQRAAFKVFYKMPAYQARKSKKTVSAEFVERQRREEKFKSINNNLII